MYNQQSTFRGPNDELSPKNWPVLDLQQNLPVSLTVELVEAEFVFDDGSSDGSSDAVDYGPNPQDIVVTVVGSASSSITSLELRFKVYDSGPVLDTVDGEIVDATHARFELTAENLCNPGLFLGDIMLFDDSDADNRVLKFNRRVFLCIEQNSSDAFGSPSPLTIAELRLELRDQEPDVNYLLDDMEFTDREIAKAIRDVVDLWNETPPNLRYYNYATFPWRFHWSRAAAGLLLQRKAKWLLRNHLSYSAGGITVDDTSRWQSYQALGSQMLEEYMTWMTRKKFEINVDGAFGYVS